MLIEYDMNWCSNIISNHYLRGESLGSIIAKNARLQPLSKWAQTSVVLLHSLLD